MRRYCCVEGVQDLAILIRLVHREKLYCAYLARKRVLRNAVVYIVQLRVRCESLREERTDGFS